MRNNDKIAEITSDTGDKKISMSLSDMQELINYVIKQQPKRGKKQEADEDLENYLLPQDIEDIINDFVPLEHAIKLQESETTGSFIDLMCGLVENAIYTRVRDLSRQRKIEKVTEFASAQARDDAQTPRYYRPWRRLFRLTPNEAMELINNREKQTARLLHLRQQVDNDNLEKIANDWELKYESGQPINFDGDEEETEEEVDEEVAPTLPVRKRRAKPPEQEPSEEKDGDRIEGQITIEEATEAPSDDEEDEEE